MYLNNFFLNIIVNNLTLVSLDSVDENRGPAASEEKSGSPGEIHSYPNLPSHIPETLRLDPG